MGVVTLRSRSSQMEDSYGIAVSTGKIRQFLKQNAIAVTSEPAGEVSLSAEEVVAKSKPATVCILVTRTSATQPSGKP